MRGECAWRNGEISWGAGDAWEQETEGLREEEEGADSRGLLQ